MTMTHQRDEVTVEFLKAFDNAWNRHDVDEIMSFFDEDCVFITGWGARFEGPEQVREAVAEFFRRFPNAKFSEATHIVRGKRGLSEWSFSATGGDGKELDMIGCDTFRFKNGKIAVKNAFRKDRGG